MSMRLFSSSKLQKRKQLKLSEQASANSIHSLLAASKINKKPNNNAIYCLEGYSCAAIQKKRKKEKKKKEGK
jgi:hypothetical protein